MSNSEFLILSAITGAISFTLLTTLVLNGYRKCQFCTMFWIGVILIAIYGYFYGYKPELILAPFCSVAFAHLFNK